MKKSELEPQQVFYFIGYRFDLVAGRVPPTPDRWITLQEKLLFIKSRESCRVRQFMSLIGLLTATEKQVWSGRLQMRPIQWHLKRHWRVPEVLEKIIPVPQSLHPHLDWWLDEHNVLGGQPLHPLQHALQLFTDASNEGWGAHLGDSTARGIWSLPESRLLINFLELKAALLALKSFELLYKDQIVLVATDNTTVVSYINKQGGMKSGSLCPPLEASILVPSQRNNSAGKAYSGSLECDSGQDFQTQSSDSNKVVPFSTGVQSVVLQMAPTTDRLVCNPVQSQAHSVCVTGTGSYSLGSGRLDLDVYAFPPVSLITQIVSKMGDHRRHRMILIAPGWPNMPWFWDLVTAQWSRSQESQQSQSACLAPRVSAIQKQGFSDEVAGRIEAPQRGSTRAVYKSKWAIFVRWCQSHEMDFRSPSVYTFLRRKICSQVPLTGIERLLQTW